MRCGRPARRGGGSRGRRQGALPPLPAPPAEQIQIAVSKPLVPAFNPLNYPNWAFHIKSCMTADRCFGPFPESVIKCHI